MPITAYLYALIQPQTGQVQYMDILSDPNYSGPCGPADLVATRLLEQDGPDFEAACANLLRSVSMIPNLRVLWGKFGRPRGDTP